MLLNGKNIGLNTYLTATEGYSPDVQDEVRSAILDGVELGGWLKGVGDDSYLLGQIRLALREEVPELYLNIRSAKALKVIRGHVRQSINLKQIERYIKRSTDEEVLLTVLELAERGIDLEGYDFNKVPSYLLPLFKDGILRGIPMEQFNNGRQYTLGYIRHCLTIRMNNQPIEAFLAGDWQEDSLEVVAGHSGSRYYGSCIRYIKPTFSEAFTDVIFQCASSGMEEEVIAELSEVSEEDGRPLFMDFQVERVLQAYQERLEWRELIDPMLGLEDLNNLLEKLRLNANPRLSVRIRNT